MRVKIALSAGNSRFKHQVAQAPGVRVVRRVERGTVLVRQGRGSTAKRMAQLVRYPVKAVDLGKIGSCHLFRHPIATLMLENGADIRFIQATHSAKAVQSPQAEDELLASLAAETDEESA